MCHGNETAPSHIVTLKASDRNQSRYLSKACCFSNFAKLGGCDLEWAGYFRRGKMGLKFSDASPEASGSGLCRASGRAYFRCNPHEVIVRRIRFGDRHFLYLIWSDTCLIVFRSLMPLQNPVMSCEILPKDQVIYEVAFDCVMQCFGSLRTFDEHVWPINISKLPSSLTNRTSSRPLFERVSGVR